MKTTDLDHRVMAFIPNVFISVFIPNARDKVSYPIMGTSPYIHKYIYIYIYREREREFFHEESESEVETCQILEPGEKI